MKKSEKNSITIIIVAILLIIITLMDTLIVFQMTSTQTMDSGIYRLKSISGELESSINEAKNLTMRLAMSAEMYLDDKDAVEAFIYEQKEILEQEDIGCFNVYISGLDWAVLPELENPEEFESTKRIWYTGAVRNGGEAYVSSPYTDVITGDFCYTVSVLLADGETVLAVDYRMDTIQTHIVQMYQNGSEDAVIVTEDGIIAGCTNDSLIGKNLNDELPDYAGIFSLVKNKDEFVTARKRDGLFHENMFAVKTGFGWYLILSESDWELYKNSYIQLGVTVLLSIALMLVIIILYMMSLKSRQKAEEALNTKEEFLSSITGELWEPLREIVDGSSRENLAETSDYEQEFEKIHQAGNKLTEMIEQIISYSNIVRSEREQESGHRKSTRMNAGFRTTVLFFMVFVMIVSLYMNISATYKWGNVMLQSEAHEYEKQLSDWLSTQKSILDMFCSVISTNPDMLDDYEETIAYLDGITKQYPDISVSYMTNPDLEPSVYMNNGWKPEADWHVEERQWYIDTLASESGWSVSAPYYDEQTGLYCVTLAERVYDAETGEFLGNFGIDFYMDRLVNILGSSYSDTGYAFLVDGEGNIINHPYGRYQMTVDKSMNVAELAYGEAEADGRKTSFIKDYDKAWKLLIATQNTDSNFTVYVVSSVWKIYGKVFVYGFICIIAFLICIILVYRILTDMIKWQDETNAQLKEAADAAIAAGQSKSRFLAQMSHEIRTPINAVLGMNEMILRESKEENTLEYASNIQSAGRTLLALINSILDFSKIEDGKMEIIPVNYNVAAFVNNLVNSISERAKAKNLELKIEIDKELPSTLNGDDVRLTQVIMNLLTNAVKYTEKGSVTLLIRGGKRTDDTIELMVAVEDTGIGIKQEDMDKLFESFERIEEKRNRNIEGTGLGMSIVTKLLEMMGSRLTVNSKYGQGSTFSFTISQTIVDAVPLGDYRKHIERADQKKSEGKQLFAEQARILVVDDNAMNLKVFKGLIKMYGIVPDMVLSGKDTITAVGKKPYDIIFLDHLMPQMDGIETLTRLRETSAIPESTVVIALTANAVVGARGTYIAAGFQDYLSKPIEVDELEKLLVTYLPKDVITYQEKKKEQAVAPKTSLKEFLEKRKEAQKKAQAKEAMERTGQEPGEGLGVAPVKETAEETVENSNEALRKNSQVRGSVETFGEEPKEAQRKKATDEGSTEASGEGPKEAQRKNSQAKGSEEGSLEDSNEMLQRKFKQTDIQGKYPGETNAKIFFQLPSVSDDDRRAVKKGTIDDKIMFLKNNGIDVENGLTNNKNEKAFYFEKLSEFVKNLSDCEKELTNNYEAMNVTAYEAAVSTLRRRSNVIGATLVSDYSKRLEQAAGNNDVEFIQAHHDNLLYLAREYGLVISAVL